MSGYNKKTSGMISTNKKKEDISNKTYTVERLLKRRKRKGRIEYLVKWKHYDKSHNSWEPEGNILDKSLIDLYKKQTKLSSSSKRNSSSPKKPQQTSIETLNSTKNELEKTDDIEQEEKDKTINSTPIDYWYPPVSEQKTKIAITDITSDNVTITFREII